MYGEDDYRERKDRVYLREDIELPNIDVKKRIDNY